ncbi:magnesium-translocating P-type ATPase [Flavobacterium soyangense]|uniref:Magnesium-transporting ATPase, P-type 1 n=1 Tax=Flavobacterium soyangense TaxID=2023265 RepID=A0A930XYF7_9FLAO|nr:magnesium-translocating P-type ATPase [Flavobacterium soyangense]MBF2707778.1 magnesium-translocating P-type ATPase [Flavobacterium soyangense]
MQTQPTATFWQFDTNYWFQKLGSSHKGLSQIDVNKILAQTNHYKKKKSIFIKEGFLFISQFKSPLMLLLIGAVILSAFLGDTSDVFIILFIVLSTGLLSFFQERNAGRIVEKLQSIIALKSKVIREGIEKEIISSEIVSGDILLLKAGDMLPADCLIIESNELHANEASLTGESYPTAKAAGILVENTELVKRTNCLWEGTNIVSGSAKVLVINTGNETIFGNIAKSAATVVETTFEKGIKDFGFFLMKITLVLSLFILVVNLLNHKSVIESALFALALAVGMAPELLPAITTIAMSAGAKRMLSKKVIVKKLASIQNLGEINLLCTDKTGTITEGSIKVAGTVDGLGIESEFVKELAYWNANFETGYANPIDDALKQLALVTKIKPTKFGEIPYDFIRKRLSITVSTNEDKILITKGAFAQIISICSFIRLGNGDIENIESHQAAIEKKFEQFGIDGLRAIGVCYKKIIANSITKEDETNMIFGGFILLEDPIKEGIDQTIEELLKLQVHLKIISGDNKNVAKSIALKIGIKNPVVMTGQEIFNVSPEALKHLVRKVHIFAEVEPQQKEHIIQALRKTYSVGYMGDGINDVSAISAADVGISVENAVDVAREAADFVLMQKDLMVIIDGIKEGRKTFANTLKYIFINTGSTFGNMFSVAIASLILPFLPMLPKQILLMNFITSFPYLTIASDNVDQEQLDKPGKWNLKSIRTFMVIFGIHSSVFDVITFLTLYYVLKVKESDFRTGWFVESILTELFILFIIRTHKNFFKSKPGKYLFILSIIGLIVTLSLPYMPFAGQVGLSPLPLLNLGIMITIVLAYIITADLLKVWFFKTYRSR